MITVVRSSTKKLSDILQNDMTTNRAMRIILSFAGHIITEMMFIVPPAMKAKLELALPKIRSKFPFNRDALVCQKKS